MIRCDGAEPSHFSSSHVCAGCLVCVEIPSISPLNTLIRPCGPTGSASTPTWNLTDCEIKVVFQSPARSMAMVPCANRSVSVEPPAPWPSRLPGAIRCSGPASLLIQLNVCIPCGTPNETVVA